MLLSVNIIIASLNNINNLIFVVFSLRSGHNSQKYLFELRLERVDYISGNVFSYETGILLKDAWSARGARSCHSATRLHNKRTLYEHGCIAIGGDDRQRGPKMYEYF